jgi:hypothetical protein
VITETLLRVMLPTVCKPQQRDSPIITRLLQSFPLSIQDLVRAFLATTLSYLNLSTAIPTIKDGGNHTPGFERAAATIEAHNACLDITKALAATGVRVLIDDEFMARVIIMSSEKVAVTHPPPSGQKNLRRG